MYYRLASYILLTLWSSSTWALNAQSGGNCFEACELSLQTCRFQDSDPGAPLLTRECRSSLRLESLYFCASTYCADGTAVLGLNGFNETCQSSGNTTLASVDVFANHTEAEVRQWRKIERNETTNIIVLDEAVLPSETLFRLSLDTIVRTGCLQSWVHGS
jgi:hypothetical protein